MLHIRKMGSGERKVGEIREIRKGGRRKGKRQERRKRIGKEKEYFFFYD